MPEVEFCYLVNIMYIKVAADCLQGFDLKLYFKPIRKDCQMINSFGETRGGHRND